MKIKRFYICRTAILLMTIIVPAVVNAQPNPGGDPDVPIDGGLSLLLAAGVGYGAKKVHDARKKNKRER